MCVIFTIYHTCNLEGSLNSIFKDSPYKSDSTAYQWLGNGYYFWTDSDFFAHKWGERKDKYPKGYVITEYLVDIPENLFLDLVGNVKDQLVFKDQILNYVRRMNLELNGREDARNIPISKVLDHLRMLAQNNQDKFKYDAIKAMDYSSVHTYSYKFTEEAKQRELIPIPSRQQLYLSHQEFLRRKKLFCAKKIDGKNYKTMQINNKEKFILEYEGN